MHLPASALSLVKCLQMNRTGVNFSCGAFIFEPKKFIIVHAFEILTIEVVTRENDYYVVKVFAVKYFHN